MDRCGGPAPRVGIVLLSTVLAGCEPLAPAPGPQPPTYGGVVETLRAPNPAGSGLNVLALDAEHIYADLGGAAGVAAIHRRTGARVWNHERPLGGPAGVVLHRDRVHYAGRYAAALEARSGRELWRFDPGEHAGFGISAAHEGGFYFGTDRHLFALSVADGSLLWRTDVGPGWEHRAIVRGVSVSGDTVYAAVERYLATNGHLAVGYVFALDRHTGQILWTHQEGDGSTRNFFGVEPTVAGDWLIAADHQANSHVALDRRTGEVRWRAWGEPGWFGALDAPKVSNDTVYTSSADGWVRALALETGRELWATRPGGSVSALILCGDRVLAHSFALFVLERTTGRLLGTAIYSTASRAYLLTSRFVGEGNEAYVLGTLETYGYRCPG